MSESGAPKPALQFDTAEYSSTDSCNICQQPTGSGYYRVSGNMACAACTEDIRKSLPVDSHSAFSRALLFGFGAALIGLALYATFEIVTEFTIGYVSLAVGWLVAAAMMKGSRGAGGRRYQIAAVLLTYFAVSVAAVPVLIHQSLKEKKEQAQVTQKTESAEGVSKNAEPATDSPKLGFFSAVAVLIGIGLASPFLEFTGSNPASAFIGLIILFVGMRIAWRIAAGTPKPEIDGPF